MELQFKELTLIDMNNLKEKGAFDQNPKKEEGLSKMLIEVLDVICPKLLEKCENGLSLLENLSPEGAGKVITHVTEIVNRGVELVSQTHKNL